MTGLTSKNIEELQTLMAELGEPKFRARQVFEWLSRGVRPEGMTNLPKTLREKLGHLPFGGVRIHDKRLSAKDGTIKYLFELEDGNIVEGVLMRYKYGNTLCISTQVGCRMGCAFCASTLEGCVRDLEAGELIGQILAAQADSGLRVAGIVLMGIGEPLDNYENVIRFLELLSDAKGRQMSLRHVTLSTCGIVPRIRELADRKSGLTLAVSLHNPTDAGRSAVMPVNRRYPLSELMEACRYFFSVTGRRVTYEYAVMQGENDSEADARALAALLKGQQAHVNLIPVNAVKERSYHATRKAAQEFMHRLEKCGVHATVRRTLGSDIEAACGQLRHEADGTHG